MAVENEKVQELLRQGQIVNVYSEGKTIGEIIGNLRDLIIPPIDGNSGDDFEIITKAIVWNENDYDYQREIKKYLVDGNMLILYQQGKMPEIEKQVEFIRSIRSLQESADFEKRNNGSKIIIISNEKVQFGYQELMRVASVDIG